MISSQGAASAARTAGRGVGTRVPLPPYARAINQETARATALNMNAIPPSLDQYVKSGGTATFPWQAPGITPQDAVRLGMVGKRGQPLSFLSQAQLAGAPLTNSQLLQLADWYKSQGKKLTPQQRGQKIEKDVKKGSSNA